MKFEYQARDKDGEVQTGNIEASSKESAIMLLQKNDLYVTVLEEAGLSPVYAKNIEFFERVGSKDLVLFSRQLSILFKAKVSLVESLQSLGEQTKKKSFKEKIFKICEEIEAGTSLSTALANYPKIFSGFYIAMVSAGEVSGKLSETLTYLSEHLEKNYELTSKIKGAMIYPAMVLTVALGVLVMMMYFVVPQLSQTLKQGGQELPAITVGVIAVSDFTKNNGLFLLIAFVALIAGLIKYKQTKRGKEIFDELILKIPLVGNCARMIYLSRFAENLSTLITGGIHIAQALEITGEIVGNETYKKAIIATRDNVRKGQQISAILNSYPNLFPTIFTQMVSVGERSGTMDKTLIDVADFYQKEVDRSVSGIISVLEPLMMVFLGGVVALIMGSILMPMYTMEG